MGERRTEEIQNTHTNKQKEDTGSAIVGASRAPFTRVGYSPSSRRRSEPNKYSDDSRHNVIHSRYSCGKCGHIARNCTLKEPRVSLVSSNTSESVRSMGLAIERKDSVEVDIFAMTAQAPLDSGSMISIIPIQLLAYYRGFDIVLRTQSNGNSIQSPKQQMTSLGIVRIRVKLLVSVADRVNEGVMWASKEGANRGIYRVRNKEITNGDHPMVIRKGEKLGEWGTEKWLTK
ncbi:hypothetical protein COOONC_01539 [Cooperia oncophora]